MNTVLKKIPVVDDTSDEALDTRIEKAADLQYNLGFRAKGMFEKDGFIYILFQRKRQTGSV